MVCKLKRSLYGLKRLGRNWFECLSPHLFELNFKASVHDPCSLTLMRNGHKSWIVIWVDDVFYGSTDSQFTTCFNEKMSERFNIGKSGPLTSVLGISFKFGGGSLELAKDQMPEDGSDEQQQMLRHDYRGLVGSITYLSLSTRPDLAFRSHLLSRFLSNPGFAHFKARVTLPQRHS